MNIIEVERPPQKEPTTDTYTFPPFAGQSPDTHDPNTQAEPAPSLQALGLVSVP